MNPKHNEGLFNAVLQGNVKQIQTLLDDGALINATSYSNNWSPLHLAAYLGRTDLIETLIKGNADVNLVDINGNTALQLALSLGHRLTAELLKQDGSRLQTRNNTGETPVEEIFDDQRRKRKKNDSSEGSPVVDDVTAKPRRNFRNGVYIETKRQLDFSNVQYLTECKREMELNIEKHLKVGLEVGVGKMQTFGRGYIYKHHGIVTSVSDITQTFEIVELTATGTSINTAAALSRSCLEPRVVKTCITFTTKHLFYYDYNDLCYEHKTIKERAESLFSLFESCGVKYNLYRFNCEHFASYCATGLAFSRQISHVNWEATTQLDKRLKWLMERQLISK